MAAPLLVVSDGAKGLIAAIEQIYPKALRQRCLIHRLRNVLAKIPTGMQAEIRDGYPVPDVSIFGPEDPAVIAFLPEVGGSRLDLDADEAPGWTVVVPCFDVPINTVIRRLLLSEDVIEFSRDAKPR